MRRWLYLCLLVGLSGTAGAQQKPAQPAPPPSSSSEKDASGLSRDTTFPEDDPAQPTPANDSRQNDPAKKRTPSMTPPRSDRVQIDDLGPGVGESSSKDTQVDLSAPADDAKHHPQSSTAVADAEAAILTPGGISELHVWDPHKAAKSVEVGDFYFKRKNYHAAEERYREALRYKDNDAVATIRLAVCLEKLGILDSARAEYESYLKILPHGPQAAEAQKAIERLKTETGGK
jgi:tetratricopeptide (TPR) repeat protein